VFRFPACISETVDVVMTEWCFLFQLSRLERVEPVGQSLLHCTRWTRGQCHSRGGKYQAKSHTHTNTSRNQTWQA